MCKPPFWALALSLLLTLVTPSLAQTPGWKADVTKIAIPKQPAVGKIGGRAFKVERAELSNNSILELRQGGDFFPDLAMIIFLFNKDNSLQGKTFSVKPDAGINSPHLHLKVRKSGEKLPDAELFLDKITMRLTFGKAVNGKIPGQIYLCAPDKNKSWVAGTFTAVIK